MKLFLLHQPPAPASASPYRLVDEHRQQVGWANDFLDAQRIRQLSLRSLRAYGYDLLHFARWWLQRPSPTLLEMDESTDCTTSAINSTKCPSRLRRLSITAWVCCTPCIVFMPDIPYRQDRITSSAPA